MFLELHEYDSPAFRGALAGTCFRKFQGDYNFFPEAAGVVVTGTTLVFGSDPAVSWIYYTFYYDALCTREEVTLLVGVFTFLPDLQDSFDGTVKRTSVMPVSLPPQYLAGGLLFTLYEEPGCSGNVTWFEWFPLSNPINVQPPLCNDEVRPCCLLPLAANGAHAPRPRHARRVR